MSSKEYSSNYFSENHEAMASWHGVMRDERGVARTTSLFWEVRREREDPKLVPLFSLKDHDHLVDGITYISLKKIYFSYDHIPEFEYEFAMDVFGSWDHWTKICKSSMRHEFQSWRTELEIKLKAFALSQMINAARTDDAKGVSASKYLADKGYSDKRKAGRPTSEEVTRERKIQAEVQETLSKDMERLGISVVK